MKIDCRKSILSTSACWSDSQEFAESSARIEYKERAGFEISECVLLQSELDRQDAKEWHSAEAARGRPLSD